MQEDGLIPLLGSPLFILHVNLKQNYNLRPSNWIEIPCFLAEESYREYFLNFWRRHSTIFFIEWL